MFAVSPFLLDKYPWPAPSSDISPVFVQNVYRGNDFTQENRCQLYMRPAECFSQADKDASHILFNILSPAWFSESHWGTNRGL